MTRPGTPPPSPVVDAKTAPAAGSLTWLLGLGLSRAELQGHTTKVVDRSGAVVSHPLVARCWQQAQNCFSHPAVEPGESLRDQARMTLAAHLRDGFKARLKVVPAAPGAPTTDRRAAFHKAMATAYLLGLPVSSSVARQLNQVEDWTPQQAFGCSAERLVALLRHLSAETLAELGLNRIPPGEVRDEVAQAVGDFKAYVDECVANVAEMRRSDGSRGRQLSPSVRAHLQRIDAALG